MVDVYGPCRSRHTFGNDNDVNGFIVVIYNTQTGEARMKKPKISIIILSYNRPAFVHECLALLDGNLLRGLENIDYEIIISDDGSNEDTQKIYANPLRSPAEKDGNRKIEKIFVSDDRSRGAGYAWNEANKMVEGDYVLQVEDDFHLVRLFTEEQMFGVIEALETVPGMELCRLRNIDMGFMSRSQANCIAHRMEPKKYKFGGVDFEVYKKYVQGTDVDKETNGPAYQYTGNAHLRRSNLWKRLGPHRENSTIGSAENHYASKFREAGFRSGTFRPGWFFHAGSGFTCTKVLGEEGR